MKKNYWQQFISRSMSGVIHMNMLVYYIESYNNDLFKLFALHNQCFFKEYLQKVPRNLNFKNVNNKQLMMVILTDYTYPLHITISSDNEFFLQSEIALTRNKYISKQRVFEMHMQNIISEQLNLNDGDYSIIEKRSKRLLELDHILNQQHEPHLSIRKQLNDAYFMPLQYNKIHNN